MQRAGIALEGGKKKEGETMHKKKGVESGASSIPFLQTACQTPVPVHTAKSDLEGQTEEEEEEATSRFGPLPRVGAPREGKREAPSDGLTD